MALQGARELRRRLKAIRTVFKPVGRRWADDTVRYGRRYVPVVTGKTQRSIRRKNASQKKATVQAIYTARILSAGPAPHTIQPRVAKAMKFTPAGASQPKFLRKAVKHPGAAPNDFAERAARQALRDNPMADELVKLWNEAA